MVKHITRTTKEEEDLKKRYNQDVDAADEWSHITGVGTKIEAADPLAISDRSIFFSSKTQPQTKQELVQEKSEEFKDNMSNTHQYQKFVNTLLQEKVKNMKKLLDDDKRFAQEMSCFQDPQKSRSDLEKVNPKYISEHEATSLITNLESECDKMKMRLDHEQSVIDKTKTQLQEKQQQIAQLKEELKYITQRQKRPESSDPITTIKYELRKLGINDDSGNIAKALELLSKKMQKP